MGKVTRIKYFTDEKKKLISEENKKLYDKYLKSNIIKNKDVESTTFKVYKNYMEHFLVFLAEKYDNISLYSQEFLEEAVDILEDYILFCQDTLFNNKKIINTKISTISSFFIWSMKRKLIASHPFDKKLDRMKGANDEHIISSYFLNDEQIQKIRIGLLNEDKYDIQDRIIWELMLDSCNRVGAISKLTLISLDIENMMFKDIREKRGYKVEVVFSEQTKLLIEEWLEIRKELDNLKVDALFITKINKEFRQMAKGTIQERIKKFGYVIGIEDFRSHCIRKTSLNLIYEKTNNLDLAAEMGNHKSVETTRASYIKPKSKTEVREKIKELMNDKNSDNV
jgi:integrase/recombinase XerC